MVEIAIFTQKPSTLTQLGALTVISSVYQRPPETLPAQNFLFVASLGSNMIALDLPPTLLGPCSIQLASLDADIVARSSSA